MLNLEHYKNVVRHTPISYGRLLSRAATGGPFRPKGDYAVQTDKQTDRRRKGHTDNGFKGVRYIYNEILSIFYRL